jgi:hypothetical protein
MMSIKLGDEWILEKILIISKAVIMLSTYQNAEVQV